MGVINNNIHKRQNKEWSYIVSYYTNNIHTPRAIWFLTFCSEGRLWNSPSLLDIPSVERRLKGVVVVVMESKSETFSEHQN
jgi:hypothetical protein